MKTNEKLLSRALDSACTEKQRTAVEARLSDDPEARRTQEVWSQVGDRLRAMPVPPVDEELAWQAVRREIRALPAQGDATPARFQPRFAWAMAMGVVMFAVVTVLVIRQDQAGWGGLVAVEPSIDQVEWVEAEIPGATTMVFADASTGLTVIWMDVENDARILDNGKPTGET
jgi:anti-sigma factor RsiW